MGFFDSLIQQAGQGAVGYMRGQQEGEAERRKRELEEENRAQQRRKDIASQALIELQTQKAALEVEADKAKRAVGDQIDAGNNIHFPNTPEGRKAFIQHEAEKTAATTKASTRAQADPVLERTRNRAYWQQVADDLYQQYGNQALRKAGETRSPYRGALDRNELTPEMFYSAAARGGQKGRPRTGQNDLPDAPDTVLDQLVAKHRNDDGSIDEVELRKELKDLGYEYRN